MSSNPSWDARRADEFLEYRLVTVAARLEERFRGALAPLGLTPRQFSVLALLREQPQIIAADLARGVLVTPQSMRVLLDQLEARGLVVRSGPRGKGNAAPAQLTDAGHAALVRAYERVEELDARTLAALGRPGYDQLIALVDDLAAALD